MDKKSQMSTDNMNVLPIKEEGIEMIPTTKKNSRETPVKILASDKLRRN